MSKSLVSEFLEKYKSLEMVLRLARGNDMTVLKYEDTLDEDDSDKMRICRVVRNFLQHTPKGDSFIQPTAAMVTFIEKQILLVTAAAEKAKDLAYKAPVIKESMSLQEMAKVFAKAKGKYEWLPVVDLKGAVLGVLTESRLMEAISMTASLEFVPVGATAGGSIKKSELAKSLADIPVVDVTGNLEAFARARKSVIVTRGGKYSGVIQW